MIHERKLLFKVFGAVYPGKGSYEFMRPMSESNNHVSAGDPKYLYDSLPQFLLRVELLGLRTTSTDQGGKSHVRRSGITVGRNWWILLVGPYFLF